MRDCKQCAYFFDTMQQCCIAEYVRSRMKPDGTCTEFIEREKALEKIAKYVDSWGKDND